MSATRDLDSEKAAQMERLRAAFEVSIPVDVLPSTAVLGELAARWCERQRHWHGPEHVLTMIQKIDDTTSAGEERDILLVTAIYHDIIYDPRATDNEEASARLLESHARDPDSHLVRQAAELIRASAWSGPINGGLLRRFFELDTWQLSDECPLDQRLDYERAIFREYQWTDWPTYRAKRREFLTGWGRRFPEHRRGTSECVELLDGLQPRIAVYPGSFAPFHFGHLSILRQAESMFDKVIVAVGINRQKPGAMESAEKRFADLQSRLRFHEVACFEGLLTRFVDAMPWPATVVRGIRDGTDVESELRFARFLNELRPRTGVVWINCEAELQHLSSSAIRELESIEPGAGQRYIPGTEDIYLLPTPAPSSRASHHFQR